MEPNHIYQYSLLNALMDGVTQSGIPSSLLTSKGNLGLGTFIHMDGELLLLEDTVYRLQAEGKVTVARPDDQIPFVTTINFVPQRTKENVELKVKEDIDAVLNEWDKHAGNLFMAYRITGTFARVKCRTVKASPDGGGKLSDTAKTQFVDTYTDVKGTVVGFRSPRNWSGFAVAGEHLHFIDDERSRGGHVLELEGRGVKMEMSVSCNVHVELPTSEAFNEANLVTDDDGIRKAEG